jgi:peptidyl-prolyl cis-trans isomerase D
MLRGIHKASANWLGRVVMGVVLGLIAISFAIWGIGDIFRGFGQSTIAKVGGTEIRIDAFRQAYQDQLQQLSRRVGRPILPDQARALGLDRQVLGKVIADTLLEERVRAMGLGVTDAEIARRITEDPNFRGLSGQFDRARFDMIIRQVGYNEARYLAELRQTILRQQISGTVSGEIVVPNAMLDAFNRYQNEQRTVEYVLLTRDQAGNLPQPTAEMLTKYFEARKVLFRAPEYRKLRILPLTLADVGAMIEVSDADLKKTYEAQKARYVTPERRHIQQIVFPNAEEARAAADKIAKGATFAKIAEERKLKESDIDLGTVARTAIVDNAIADAAFALKANEVSTPVQGRFGVALLRVLKIEPAQTKSFEAVAEEIKREIVAERAKNELLTLHDKIDDERLGGASLTDTAKKFNLKVRTIDAVDRSGQQPDGTKVADLPQGVDVLAAAFAAGVGSDHEPLQIGRNEGYVWYDVVEITPSRERSFDEVKDQVLARWRDDEIATRLKVKAAEMLDKIKGGMSFAQAAAANKVKPEWRPGIKRGSPTPGLSARAIDGIFKTAKGATGTADGANPTERIVFHVTEITVPPLDPNSAEGKRIKEALTQALGNDLLGQYVTRLEKDAGVTINQSALNQVIGGSAN